MMKQEILEAQMYRCGTSIRENATSAEDQKYGLCMFYEFAHVLALLRPDWFDGKRQAQAFSDMLAQFKKYRDKAGRDNEYVRIARESKVVPLLLFGSPDSDEPEEGRSLISIQDLGVICSSSAADRKFARHAILQYAKQAFPRGAKAFAAYERERQGAVRKLAGPFRSVLASPLTPGGAHPSRASSSLLELDPDVALQDLLQSGSIQDAMQEKSEQFSQLLHKDTCLYFELVRYTTILHGRNALFLEPPEGLCWQYSRVQDGPVSVEPLSRMAQAAACLRPTSEACAFCQPEFRHLLATLYYVRESGLPEGPLSGEDYGELARYYELSGKVVLPLVDDACHMASTAHEMAAQADGAAEQASEELEDARAEIASLRETVKAAEQKAALAARPMEELENAKKELAGAKRAAASLSKEREHLRRVTAALEKEKAALEQQLSERQACCDSLNQQLLDLIEEQDDFLEDGAEQQETEAGIRARIGEDVYQKLASKRIALVGGHENTRAALRALFPNWKFFPTDAIVPDTLSSVDALGVITSYVSHKSFYRAKGIAKSRGIPFVSAFHNGPSSICRTLAAQLPGS